MTAIWVDFGGVLTPSAAETIAAFCDRVGTSPERLGTAMFAVAQAHGTTDVMEPLDTPLVSGREWAAQVQKELLDRFGEHVDMSNFGDLWFADRPPNTVLLDYLRSLRERGCFVAMLSNMVPAFEPHWRKMAPPEELFEDVVMSYEVGVRKPQRAIYDLAARRAGVEPHECVLVDDLPHNCDAARAAGWQAVVFTRNDEVIEQLEALLEAVRPRS